MPEERNHQFRAIVEWQVQLCWFDLDQQTRRDYTRQVRDIIKRYPKLRFRWFDAEAWTGKFTDFSLIEFEDLDLYNSFWGELRRHPFLSTPFAVASRVLVGNRIHRPEPELPSELPAVPLCRHCQSPVKATAKFCGSCGQPNPVE